jgi:hypothetical protein
MRRALTMTEPLHDIQRIWHEQPREEHPMAIEEIRSRAKRFEQKTRRWNIVTAVVIVLVMAVESWQVWRETVLPERAGDLLTMAALLYTAYRFRGYAAQAMPAGLGLTGSVEFYRQQLARQRDLAGHPWRYLVLFIPGVSLSLLGRSLDRPVAQTAMVAAFGVALFLTVAWINRRTAQRLQREIDQL